MKRTEVKETISMLIYDFTEEVNAALKKQSEAMPKGIKFGLSHIVPPELEPYVKNILMKLRRPNRFAYCDLVGDRLFIELRWSN